MNRENSLLLIGLIVIFVIFVIFAFGCSQDRKEQKEQKEQVVSHPMLKPSDIAVIFRDVTKESGIKFIHAQVPRASLLPEDMGSGAAFADYDNDGDLDLFMVNNPGSLVKPVNSSTCMLYRNNGNGTFSDVTHQAGVAYAGFGMGCVFGDYDNDGDLDLFITNFGPNVLYDNNGDGTFSDVTKRARLGDPPRWSMSSAWGDYDKDGDLDLYVANYVNFDLKALPEKDRLSKQYGMLVPASLNPGVFEPQENALYKNNGDGTFTNVAKKLGVETKKGKSLGVIFSDFDLDGDSDIYVANDLGENNLYQNNGDGTFTDISELSWANDFRGSMGLASGDYDNDGDFDIFDTNWVEQENGLYKNLLEQYLKDRGRGSGVRGQGKRDRKQETGNRKQENKKGDIRGDGLIHFVDEAYGMSLAEESLPLVGWGTDFFDYDNDGDLDIFFVNGHTFQKLEDYSQLIPQLNYLYRNEGADKNKPFLNVSKECDIWSLPPKVARGAAFGDYDNDGDVDVFIVNNHDSPTLLRNEGGNKNHWLHLKTVGTKSNRDGIGAKVIVYIKGLFLTREINGGSSYLSFNSLPAEFGLANVTELGQIEVKWPSGKADIIRDVKTDRMITVVEGMEMKSGRAEERKRRIR